MGTGRHTRRDESKQGTGKSMRGEEGTWEQRGHQEGVRVYEDTGKQEG